MRTTLSIVAIAALAMVSAPAAQARTLPTVKPVSTTVTRSTDGRTPIDYGRFRGKAIRPVVHYCGKLIPNKDGLTSRCSGKPRR